MTDASNTMHEIRPILVDMITSTFELDCMNHLRNVWFRNVEKEWLSYLTTILRVNLDEIDLKLWVTTSISAIILAVDKEFSLSSNYPKGHGKLFLERIHLTHAC